MKRVLTVLAVTVAISLAAVGAAFADPPVQSATQSSTTGQTAGATSSTTQAQPTNQNISVRVLSPGDDGAVTQSNNASSNASATNTASTTQQAQQNAAAACGCALAGAPVQVGTQTASTTQGAIATSSTQQIDPSNANLSVRVLSPGNNGATTQSNTAASTGTAGNTASTKQTDTQAGSGVQSAVQGAETSQAALAGSTTKQVDPSNSTTSVRVLSPGNAGNVSQSNTATSTADARNTAPVTQTATQTGKSGCGCSGSGDQYAGQWSGVGQLAGGVSGTTQAGAANDSSPAGVDSKGSGGKVDQSNDAASTATAANTAPVSQSAAQAGGAVQAAEQGSHVDQAALAGSATHQIDASNTADPVRIGSHGSDGSVTQANEATSTAKASNDAKPTQTATQAGHEGCGCSGSGVQYSGQWSSVDQLAGSVSDTTQKGAANDSSPTRVDSGGSGGKVDQSNDAASTATAANTAPVSQSASQHGAGIQVVAQESQIGQAALAGSAVHQFDPSNTADPVRIKSNGSDGSVTQANDATSKATAANTAAPTQTATQANHGGCGCSGTSVQALGQSSYVDQLAGSLSDTTQKGAANDSSPIRVDSYGSGGKVEQSNDAASTATATNKAPVTEKATQSGSGIQAIAQESSIGQAALAGSSTAQLGDHRSPCGCGSSSGNTASPTRIGSGGSDGSTRQSNSATSDASASNTASPLQDATTLSHERCGCHGTAVQVLGQESDVDQLALASSSVVQLGPGNIARPIRIGSHGSGGSSTQSNRALGSASASNSAPTMQIGRLMI